MELKVFLYIFEDQSINCQILKIKVISYAFVGTVYNIFDYNKFDNQQQIKNKFDLQIIYIFGKNTIITKSI